MAFYVQKFGGTSVGTVERIAAVADKVKAFRDAGHDSVVVVSAMSGETNRLVSLANAVMEDPTPREMDVLLSTGEQVTIALLCMALNSRGCPAKSYTGSQVRITTDSTHTKARIQSIDEGNIRADIAAGNVVVVAGFQGLMNLAILQRLGVAAQTPLLLLWLLRSRRTNVRFILMLTGYIPLILVSLIVRAG